MLKMKNKIRFSLTVICGIFIFVLSACSQPSGNLIPFSQEGAQLSSSLIENEKDTIEINKANLKIKMLGRWQDQSVRLFVEIKNTGTEEIKINLSKIKLTGNEYSKVELNTITEQKNLLEFDEKTDRQIYYSSENRTQNSGSPETLIKSAETKIYALYYLIFLKDVKSLRGDEVEFQFPSEIFTNSSNQASASVKFKCVSSSDLKYFQRGEPRKQPEIQ